MVHKLRAAKVSRNPYRDAGLTATAPPNTGSAGKNADCVVETSTTLFTIPVHTEQPSISSANAAGKQAAAPLPTLTPPHAESESTGACRDRVDSMSNV